MLWLNEKNDTKIHVFEILIFWKRTASVSLKKFSSNTIFWEILHSYIQLFQWKRSFEIFLIDHCAGDIENKNKYVSTKESLYQCQPP